MNQTNGNEGRVIVILAGLVLALCGVSTLVLYVFPSVTRHQSSDPFFAYTTDLDSSRIPLLKPYAATYINGDPGWEVALHPFEDGESIAGVDVAQGIERIAVEGGVILLATPEQQGQPEAPCWFVLIPEQKIERGFQSEADFTAYLATLGMADPAWKDVVDLASSYRRTGCLDWIPDCNPGM